MEERGRIEVCAGLVVFVGVWWGVRAGGGGVGGGGGVRGLWVDGGRSGAQRGWGRVRGSAKKKKREGCGSYHKSRRNEMDKGCRAGQETRSAEKAKYEKIETN